MPTESGHTTAIPARKVIGTTVCDPSGDKIGVIEDVMLDKVSNSIMFAVVGFDGVLGLGEKFHPVPWATLNFDEGQNSYVVPYSKDELKLAPAGSIDELTQSDALGYRDKSYDYYQATPYW
jgi:sporulation protein YlmC with PRC-barrel domain